MLPIDSCGDYSMIPSAFGRPAVKKVSLSEQIDRFEQILIEDALAEHRGNAELASRCLGIPKRTLYDKIRKFGLSTDAFRSVRDGQQ